MAELVIRIHEGDVGHLLDAVRTSRGEAENTLAEVGHDEHAHGVALLHLTACDRITAATLGAERPGQHPALFELETGTS